MEESDLDCSAGSIVWVRRRNGSWWPAKILGAEELSDSHITSPRSGTPVKLLGREDASVDWYNLERSKRVKAFRCGEFDDCIHKAEKLQGASIKKREKYARREDAIIHALHLETQNFHNKHLNTTSATLKELPTSSQRLGNAKVLNLNSHPVTKGLASLHAQRTKHFQEDATPQMRALHDFGLRIAPKRKAFDSLLSEVSPRPTSANVLPSLVRADTVSSTKTAIASKRKRTQSGLVKESLNKRRDRRRPLHQVLQNTAQLSAIPTSQSDGDVSPSMLGEKEQTRGVFRAKRSQCVYLPVDPNDNLDFTECPSEEMQITATTSRVNSCHISQASLKKENPTSRLMDEAKSDSSGSDQDTDEDVPSEFNVTEHMEGPSTGRIEGKSESTSSKELDELVAVNAYRSIHHPDDQAVTAADLGVSKWKLKGKRNIRYIMRKSNESIGVTCLEGEGKWSNQKALRQQSRYNVSEVLDYDYDEDEMIEKNSVHNKLIGSGIRRYPPMSKGLSKDRTEGTIGIVDSEEDSIWETDGLSQEAFRGYLDKSGCQDPIHNGSCLGYAKKSVLVDVDLKVQASYQGEHVPLVSLMSRLNGKAIIGHPIQIEALEDGSSEMFLSTNNDCKEGIDGDGGTSVAPAWRTGRRTIIHRIPRPHPFTGLDVDSSGDHVLYSDPESKHVCNNSHVLHPDQVAGKSHDVFHPTEKKCTKRPTKKVSSIRKTRTLSSIAVEQKLNGKLGNQKAVKRNGSDGLIKPVNGPATITCIPVKLVFSRLLEAVGRPPSRPGN